MNRFTEDIRVCGGRFPICGLFLLLALLSIIPASAARAAPSSSAWSDTKIVYNDTFSTLLVVNPDGSDPHPLLQEGHQLSGGGNPKWSPDGERVTFNSSFAGPGEEFTDSEIVVTDAGGFDLDILTANTFDDYHPTWSPDGSQIAFISDRDAGGFGDTDIYVMDADGANQSRLTTTSEIDMQHPDWSPDGSMIVFNCGNRICVVNSDGTGLTAITPEDENGIYAAWSPDGSRIAYTRESLDIAEDIVLIDPDGSDPVSLTSSPEAEYGASWSADGEKIALLTTRDGVRGLYHMNAADGSDLTLVVEQSGIPLPDWQPVAFDPPPPSDTLYISPRKAGKAAGITVKPQDILAHNLDEDTWEMYFDGSDVGVDQPLAAFTHMLDDSLLLAFSGAENLPGLNGVTPSDIVRFVPTSTGDTTAGTFEWYLDGSDVGLSSSSEKIDALDIIFDNSLYISFTGNANVPQGGGNQLMARDEDLVFYEPTTTGADSSGTWYYLQLDGSTVPGLAAEDLSGFHLDWMTNEYYLSVLDGFNIAGASGNGKDIVKLARSGNSYVATRFWRGPEHGFNLTISGFELDLH